MAIRITADIANPGATQRAIRGAVGRELSNELRREGEQMAKRATELMGQKFNLNRPFERRRWPGSRRARTAIDYQLDGDASECEFELRYRILGGEEVFLRVLGLNFGTPAHTISPAAGGGWPLRGVRPPANRFRKYTRSEDQGDRLAWETTVVRGSVEHPGTAGGGFLEEARDEMVRRVTA